MLDQDKGSRQSTKSKPQVLDLTASDTPKKVAAEGDVKGKNLIVAGEKKQCDSRFRSDGVTKMYVNFRDNTSNDSGYERSDD